MVKRIVTVSFSWRLLGDDGVVLLGNGMAGFYGCAVLVGYFIVSGEMYCKGGF